ncbi:MAG: LacI family transcriptional regulator [Chlorobi bacterium CHB1]|nr:LacI family transcriptional regulator [Chlorobi bacterium CHB1]
MSARLLEIAQQTGFSVSTVSRVLHDHSNKYKISAATKALIRKAAEELGYRPNKLARGLRLNQTHEIGVIVPDISNPFFATLVKSIAGELRKSGYSIFVYDADENTAIEAESIKILLEKKVDGLIIASVGQEAVDAVSVDNFRGAYLATQYLIREGHRLIAFIQGLSGTYVNEGRLQGYKQALQESNLPLDERLIVGDDFRNYNGYLETKLLLKLQEPPTAIFTAGDLIAMGALEALKEDHYRVPQDVSLITFDDPSFATYLSPALTTVAQPVEKMGEMAVKLLFRRLRAPNGERRRILLEPRLIVRDSVMRRSSLALVRQAS